MTETKPIIGVFFGSRSPEHDVSIISAQLVMKALIRDAYTVVPIYIGVDGEWYIADAFRDISFFKSSNYVEKLKQYGGWRLVLNTNKGMMFEKKGLFSKNVVIDIAFPVFHGEMGEDGTIQGLFEMLDVLYVGSGVASSAVAMDKEFTKELYTARDIPTTAYMSITQSQWSSHKDDCISHISAIEFPLFVKPARAGSSIGISRVTQVNDLETAIEVALRYDTKVIIEKGVDNLIDLTCAVRETSSGLEASLVQQSLFSEGMFSYNDKYIKEGGAQTGNDTESLIIPAGIPSEATDTIQALSKDIFTYFECKGMARVDFLYDSVAEKLYANEVNTIPGTLYHHLWKESGVSLSVLIEDLIQSTYRERKANARIRRTFKSSILSHANENKLANKLDYNE